MNRLLLLAALLFAPAIAGAQRAIPPYIDSTIAHQLVAEQSAGRASVYCAFGARVTGSHPTLGSLVWVVVDSLTPTRSALTCPPEALGAVATVGTIESESPQQAYNALEAVLNKRPGYDFAALVLSVMPVARASGIVELVPRIALVLQARQGS